MFKAYKEKLYFYLSVLICFILLAVFCIPNAIWGYVDSQAKEAEIKNTMTTHLVVTSKMYESFKEGGIDPLKANISLFKKTYFQDNSLFEKLNEVDKFGNNILKYNGVVLNQNYDIVDEYKKNAKNSVATIFVKNNNGDFVRISTSVQDSLGNRLVNTKLDNLAVINKVTSGEEFIGVADITGEKYSALYEPILGSNGNVIGLIFIGANSDVVIKKHYSESESVKIENTGRVIAINVNEGSHKGDIIFGRDLKRGEKVQNLDEYISLQGKWGELFIDGVEHLVSSHLEKDLGILFVVEIEKSDILSYKFKNFTINIGIFLPACFIGCIVVSFMLKHVLSKPLTNLKDVFDLISKGELRNLNIAKTNRVDEIGKMHNSAYELYVFFKTLVSNLSKDCAILNKTSHQLSIEAKELENIAFKQNGDSQQLASTTTEYSARASDISGRAGEVAGMSEVIYSEANQIGEASKKNTKNIEDMQNSLNQQAEVIQSLVNKSDEVKSFVGVIDNIASQTNLLALNASIESARAGEAGRGFAVVADEVRQLAKKTSDSTKEIEAIIAQFNKELQRVIQSSEIQTNAVLNTVASNEQVMRTAEKIILSTHQTNETMSELEASIKDISDGTIELSAIAENGNNSSEQVHSICQKVSEISSSVDSNATNIMGVIANIKIDGLLTLTYYI